MELEDDCLSDAEKSENAAKKLRSVLEVLANEVCSCGIWKTNKNIEITICNVLNNHFNYVIIYCNTCLLNHILKELPNK